MDRDPATVRIEWSKVSSHFELDGSLRDLYVFDADLDISQRVVDSVVSSGYEWEFLVDGEAAALPTVSEIFEKRSERSPLLRTFAGRLAVNCHFFGTDEIEFDLYTPELSDQESLDDALDFMTLVSNASGRRVRMTHENVPDALICEARSPEEISSGAHPWFVWPEQIDLHPESGSGPVWSKLEPFYLDPRYLPVSKVLIDDLVSWQAEYDEILNHAYPPDSRFASPEAESAFWLRGAELAERLRDVSPHWVSVGYEGSGV